MAKLKPIVKATGYAWFELEPVHKLHSPVKVWGKRGRGGWEGWLEQIAAKDAAHLRTRELQPVTWTDDKWNEISCEPDRVKVSA